MKVKSSCCEKYRKKLKSCGRCPVMASLNKKQRKAFIADFH